MDAERIKVGQKSEKKAIKSENKRLKERKHCQQRPLMVCTMVCVERHEAVQVNISKINYEDLERWGIEGSIKRELILDKIIENEANPNPQEEDEEIIKGYLKIKNIFTQEDLAKWMKNENLDNKSLLTRARRHSKWVKICEKKFKNQAATRFLKDKAKLDQVSYSMIWIEDEALANEVFVRIKEEECTVDEAILMSTNPPQGLKIGRVGPIEFRKLPDALAELLRISQPKQVWPPIKIENGWAIIKNEKIWPAVFNREEKNKILLEIGEEWISEEIRKANTKPSKTNV